MNETKIRNINIYWINRLNRNCCMKLLTFGELPREQQLALFIAWLDGKSIELLGNSGKWILNINPAWLLDSVYRVAVTKPLINWDHLHPDYNAVATDSNGKSFAYQSEPVCGVNGWIIRNTSKPLVTSAHSFASFKSGTCDWQDSLIVRPGYQEKE